MSENGRKFVVGSRKSELALIQTKHVISLLKEINPEVQFEIVTMSTLGDRVLDIPLPKIGEKSLFTQELEGALYKGQVDFVVHSLKDLPTALPAGLVIGAVLSREDPRDALVLQKNLSNHVLDTLPEGSVIGTSSLRRTAQLAKKHPHLKVENIRGNLNTRLKKLDELGTYHAIVLAAAGLKRMGWTNRISKILDTKDLLYAVGQGALAVECRANDEKTIELLKPLYDVETSLRIIAERSFLKTLGGGCSAPVGVSTEVSKNCGCTFTLNLTGAVWSLDGKDEIVESISCDLPLKDIIYCKSCPDNNGGTNGDKNSTEESQPEENSINGISTKRAKLDPASVKLPPNDPHDRCPIQLPVGADFMGKCPYLDSDFLQAHSSGSLDFTKCPIFNMKPEQQKIDFLRAHGSGSLDFSKCPVSRMKQVQQNIEEMKVEASSSIDDETYCNHYCGIVAHDNASSTSQESALDLGAKLAHILMNKGAVKIMTTAQAIIHESTAVKA